MILVRQVAYTSYSCSICLAPVNAIRMESLGNNLIENAGAAELIDSGRRVMGGTGVFVQLLPSVKKRDVNVLFGEEEAEEEP